VYKKIFFCSSLFKFDICATAVMDIKRLLAIQLYPMEIQTSSRSGSLWFYFPGDVVSGIVSIFNKNISDINGRLYTDLI
jgi:hypothetical protein